MPPSIHRYQQNHSIRNNRYINLFFLIIIAIYSSIAVATEISFAAFGGKADGNFNNSVAFAKAFQFAENNPNTTLLLERGIYKVGSIAYSKNNIKSVLYIKNTTNLSIKGADTTIVFTEKAGGLFGEYNKGLNILNITFDYEPVPFNQGTIIKVVDEQSLLVNVDPGYIGHENEHYNSDGTTNNASWLIFFDENNNLITSSAPRITKTQKNNNLYLLHLDQTGVKLIKKSLLKPGSKYARTIRDWGHLLRFHFSDNVVLNNVTIHSSSEFAGLFSYSNNVRIINSKIVKKPLSSRLLSTSADGWHFIGARVGPQIINNTFEHQADDSIVISVRGSLVEDIEDSKTLKLRTANPIFYEKGDKIEIIDLINKTKQIATVKEATPRGNFPRLAYTLILSDEINSDLIRKIKGQNDLLVFNRSQSCNGTIIQGNSFKYIRARGILAHGIGLNISDNTFTSIGGAAIAGGILVKLPLPDHINDYWAYAPSENVTINRNVIDHALNWGGGWGYKASISFDSTRANNKVLPIRASFDSIKISDNTIKGLPNNKSGVFVSDSTNSTIINNVISHD